MLRRTQQDVLRHVLPPRTDLVVFCHPTVAQLDHYEAAAQRLQTELGDEEQGDEALEDAVSLSSVLPVLTQLRKTCNVRDCRSSDTVFFCTQHVVVFPVCATQRKSCARGYPIWQI